MPSVSGQIKLSDFPLPTREPSGDDGEFTGEQGLDAIINARRLQSTNPAARGKSLSNAIVLANSYMKVGEVVTTREYHPGTGYGGNSYVLLDAGSAGARPLDDGGIIIHVGSGGLYLQGMFPDGNITLERFGAQENDASTAVAALNAFCEGLIAPLDAAEGTNFGLVKAANVEVKVTRVWATNEPLITWPGIAYTFQKGAGLKAMVAGQLLVRTPTTAEYQAAMGVSYYDRKGVTIQGRGILDGNYLASGGAKIDTTASGTDIALNVARVTHRKYTTTASKTNGSNAITLASAANVTVLDTIEIGNDAGEFYTIISLVGTDAVLDRPVVGTDAAASVQHRAVGISYHMAQQGSYAGYVTDCDVGEVFTKNTDSYDCTDFEMKGECRRCNTGLIGVALSECHGSKTVIRNYGRDMVLANGDNANLTVYAESLSDADADSLTTPTGGGAVGQAALRALPMIDVLVGYEGAIFDIIYPMNTTAATWRRLLRNAGQDTVVTRLATRSESRPENPSRSGDYAFAEQASGSGQLLLQGVMGPTNLSTIADKLVVDETGARPANYRANWSCIFNAKLAASIEAMINYVTNTSTRAQEFRTVGEAFSRCAIGSGGLFLGDGSANPVRAVRWGNNGVQIDALLNITNSHFARLQQPNGAWQYLWVDNSGNLRISGTEPSDRNTDGAIVGSQA